MFVFWNNFELGLMVKWKYPCLFIWISEIWFISLICPILWSIASEYPPIFGLYDSECRSFVETQIIPRLLRELVIRSSVDHFQLSKFIIKPFRKQNLTLAHIYQAIRSIKFKTKHMCRLDNLMESLNNHLRFWLTLDLWLSLKIYFWLIFNYNLVLRLFQFFPQEIEFWWILFVLFIIMKVLVNSLHLFKNWN